MYCEILRVQLFIISELSEPIKTNVHWFFIFDNSTNMKGDAVKKS